MQKVDDIVDVIGHAMRAAKDQSAINAKATIDLALKEQTERGIITNAIDQLAKAVGAIDVTSVLDDATPTEKTTYSSVKIQSLIKNEVDARLALDSNLADMIKKINDAIGGEGTLIDRLFKSFAGAVRWDAPMSLKPEEQQVARTNIGSASQSLLDATIASLGDVDNTDLRATFAAALAA
jgi:hypothetical protein